MKLSTQLLNDISNIQWLANCGNMFTNDNVDMPIQYINSWENAKKSYQLQKWEDTTLEARNHLTSFLHDKYRTEYTSWNLLVKEAKKFIENELVPQLNLVKEENNLDNLFLDCVKWDILNAIVEDAYQNCKNRPTFFLDLLTIYKMGNFPCGWEGEWPRGSLLVY